MGLKLKNIDMGNIEAATAALNLFSDAAERAVAAIDALGKSQHGGVTFVSMGDVAKLDVKPTKTPIERGAFPCPKEAASVRLADLGAGQMAVYWGEGLSEFVHYWRAGGAL